MPSAKKQAKQEKKAKKSMTIGSRLLEMMVICEEMQRHNQQCVDNLHKLDNDGDLVKMGEFINDMNTHINSTKANIKLAEEYITITKQEKENLDLEKLSIYQIMISKTSYTYKLISMFKCLEMHKKFVLEELSAKMKTEGHILINHRIKFDGSYQNLKRYG